MIRMLGAAAAAVLAGCGTAIEVQVLDVNTGLPVPNAVIDVCYTPVTLVGDTHGVTDEHGIACMRINSRDAMLCDVRADGFHRLAKPAQEWVAFLQGLAPEANPPGPRRWVESMAADR